jgi:cytochrome o ubiquinol oxidase subunit 2
VAPADFAAWAQATAQTGPGLDRAAYALLARPSHKVPPATWRQVDPHLFQAIASQTIPPAPGPQPENPAHAGRETTQAAKE